MSKLKDETGNTYGYLTVIERAENTKEGRAQWLCKCKCGNEVIVLGKHLRSGNTKSCGCYQRERAVESNLRRSGDLTGQRFGKLVVLEEAGFIEKSNGRNSRLWKCQCESFLSYGPFMFIRYFSYTFRIFNKYLCYSRIKMFSRTFLNYLHSFFK